VWVEVGLKLVGAAGVGLIDTNGVGTRAQGEPEVGIGLEGGMREVGGLPLRGILGCKMGKEMITELLNNDGEGVPFHFCAPEEVTGEDLTGGETEADGEEDEEGTGGHHENDLR
jgi:hypothetical protein